MTVSFEGAQEPFPTVQTNSLTPTERPVTPDAGSPGAVIVAVPATTLHRPVPTVGALAARVTVVAQTVWSTPAFAVVGGASRVTTTVSLDGGQLALLIVQTIVLAPTLRFVTPDVEIGRANI